MAEARKPRIRVELRTPRGVAKYPRLDVPDTKFDADGVYKVRLSWPTEVIEPLKAKVDKIGADFIAEMRKTANEETNPDLKKKLKRQLAELKPYESPFKVALDDEGEPTDRTEAEFKMKSVIRWKKDGVEQTRNQKPKVVDGKGRPTKVVPWSGSEMVVVFDAEPGYWDGQKKAGVSLKLVAAQILKLVQGSGSGEREPEFEVYDDSFEDDGSFSGGGAAEAGDDDMGGPTPPTSAYDNDDGNF